MTLGELLEMTLGEALEMSKENDSPLCFTVAGQGQRHVILIASNEDAEELFQFVKSKQAKSEPEVIN